MNHSTAPDPRDCARQQPQPLPPVDLIDATYSDAAGTVEVRDGRLLQDGKPMSIDQFAYWARRFFALQFASLDRPADACPLCDDGKCWFCCQLSEPDLTCSGCNGSPDGCYLCRGTPGQSTPF